jgi:hypothetical protein
MHFLGQKILLELEIKTEISMFCVWQLCSPLVKNPNHDLESNWIVCSPNYVIQMSSTIT